MGMRWVPLWKEFSCRHQWREKFQRKQTKMIHCTLQDFPTSIYLGRYLFVRLEARYLREEGDMKWALGCYMVYSFGVLGVIDNAWDLPVDFHT